MTILRIFFHLSDQGLLASIISAWYTPEEKPPSEPLTHTATQLTHPQKVLAASTNDTTKSPVAKKVQKKKKKWAGQTDQNIPPPTSHSSAYPQEVLAASAAGLAGSDVINASRHRSSSLDTCSESSDVYPLLTEYEESAILSLSKTGLRCRRSRKRK
jgi:hypothetical protein